MIPSRMQILNAIRNEMRVGGIKQVDLAAHLGVSQARVSQMMSHRGNMTLRTVDAIRTAVYAIKDNHNG